MRRRGHDAFGWTVLFLFLGPLALPLAVSSDRHPPLQPAAPNRDGDLDVLVVSDGSSDSAAAVEAALHILSDRITSLTVAAVVDLEASTTVRGRATQRDAQERLDAVARRLSASTRAPIDTIVLFGEPARTLSGFAVEHGYELIVAGRSLARRFPTATPVSVLIGPGSP